MIEPTNALDVAQPAHAELEMLQHKSFSYFLHETNPDNGLVIDKTAADWPASIAATGFALAAYPVAVERGFMPRAAAVERTLTTLRFFWNSPQGPEPDATGYQGFYYHFLDMRTGRRAWQCELSTIDSAFLLAGALTAGAYFDADTPDEHEIRNLAESLYCRADWQWAQDRGAMVTHGWKPESGFLNYRWEGYDEAMLLYILGLASPAHPLPESSYAAWTSTYRWEHCYGYEYLYAGPLFTHQLSHIWIDFRGDNLLPTEIEGFDSLAELALDMRWSWNHATDEVWRQLDPELWESRITPGSSCRRSRATRSSACWPIPFSARTLMTWCSQAAGGWRRPRGFSRIIRRLP
jgi:hypothetical protein